MSDNSDRSLRLLCFLLGVTLPVAVYAIWCKTTDRKKEIDQAHDITVEDSFPASDPPSAW
jgi:preprotein translocase subunit Sec63